MSACVTRLQLDEELEDLAENAHLLGWAFQRIGDAAFTLAVPAKDGSQLHMRAKVDRYPTIPPAWHWWNPMTEAIDGPSDTPVGGAFFHSNGVICAPWNRLAYQVVDPRGPHGDWSIEGNWMTNSNTLGTRTLAAMALRIAHEAQVSYTGRKQAP